MILKKKNVNKLVRDMKRLTEETNNYEMISEMFRTNFGVKQGGGSSPLLFIIYIDKIKR